MPVSLHDKMRELSTRRQGETGLREKAKWPLFEQKYSTRLNEGLVDLVMDLTDLYHTQATQGKLCDIEISDEHTRWPSSPTGGHPRPR